MSNDIIINIFDFKNDLLNLGEKVKLNTIEYEDLEIFYEQYERFYRVNNYNLSPNPMLYELLGCGNLILEEKIKRFRKL